MGLNDLSRHFREIARTQVEDNRRLQILERPRFIFNNNMLGLGVAGDSANRGDIVFRVVRATNTPFVMGMGGSNFAGGPDGANTWDDVLLIAGFNYDVSANLAHPYDYSQPALGLSMEESYWNGTYMASELNFSFTNHETSAGAHNGYNVRPLEFAVDTDHTLSNATAVMSWQFRIGNAAGSFFRIGNANIRDDLFEFTRAGAFLLNHTGGHGASIAASLSGSDTLLTFSLTAGAGAPYNVFTHGISLGGAGAVGSYDIKSGGSVYVTNNVVASGLNGISTGTSGVLLTNPFNYGSANLTLSGTAVRVRMDIGATPYYFLVYPTAT